MCKLLFVYETAIINVLDPDPPNCASGFATQNRLRSVLKRFTGGRTVLYDYQSVSPGVKFTCDANVSKWIVGGEVIADNNHNPELQVWRSSKESSEYQRVYNTGELEFVIQDLLLSASIADGVYKFPVDPPLTVQAGDVLGIYQPAESESQLAIYYDTDAGAETLYQTVPSSQNEFPAPDFTVRSHMHLPLVTVEVGTCSCRYSNALYLQ